MAELQASDFRQFFFELHQRNPFPWQVALAEQVCGGSWPSVIDLPTASGKTACIDIALFALAVREGEAPRRIFFVVDRRVVVNEAYLRMKGIRKSLCEAKQGILATAAGVLRKLAGGDENEPLRVCEMRGGAFRDGTWVENPLQPAVVASTVDQVGSRLLFRGYGVSEYAWPIHAGLIGNDALIILDEAHCSRAFAQTLERIERYRGEAWAHDPIGTPFHFVEMTATPSREGDHPFRITDADRDDETLRKRLSAKKPTWLKPIKAKADDFGKLADELIAQAVGLAKKIEAKRIAIIVNRIKTARMVEERLEKEVKDGSIELVIGRMRPFDRDRLYDAKLQNLKSDVKRTPDDPLTFVISTQCLEVGADLDFDVLVSECASIDALQQRFGRLDRRGEFERAQGAIVVTAGQANAKQPDAIYGEALANTWAWLTSISGPEQMVNMGIEAADGEPPTVAQLLESVDSREMRLQGDSAPILLPAHVDVLVQTSPVPVPDPAVEFFLHGPERSMPDVYVVWRADLDEASGDESWIETIKFCPPSSREAMPVPIHAFKKWFGGQSEVDDQESDLPLGADDGKRSQEAGERRAILWQGDERRVIERNADVKPGQTIILPVSAGGWNKLGHVPKDSGFDIGDQAAFKVNRSVSLRLHPSVMADWPGGPALTAVKDYASQDGADWSELQNRLMAYLADLETNPAKPWPHAFLSELQDGNLRVALNTYPGTQEGYVVAGRRISESGRSGSARVLLRDHLNHVQDEAATIAGSLGGRFTEALRTAAKFHDYGKVDMRYQAWLRGGDTMAAHYAPQPLAKSGLDTLGKQQTAGLPSGFRHELLSLLFAEKSVNMEGDARDLVLQLIASHHGRCRPFPPVVPDDSAECVSYGGISVCKQERAENAPYHLDRGVADRFWSLTRKYGWWGLAYLEALLRLADWRASDAENAEIGE